MRYVSAFVSSCALLIYNLSTQDSPSESYDELGNHIYRTDEIILSKPATPKVYPYSMTKLRCQFLEVSVPALSLGVDLICKRRSFRHVLAVDLIGVVVYKSFGCCLVYDSVLPEALRHVFV